MYSKIFNFSHKLSHGVVTVHRKAQKEGVDRINWANDEMKNTLHESIEKTKEAAERTSQTDVVKASIGLIDDIVGSIKKFESGDTVQIITGVLDIVNGLSVFSNFGGPAGTTIAEITGPLCSLIGSILNLSFGKKKETQEYMLKRTVTEALAVQPDDELRSIAEGEMANMNCNLVILKKLSEYPTICPESFNTISNILTSGVGFLGRLWYFINKRMVTNDEATAKRTARLMYMYSILGVRQSTLLTRLSPLYKKAGAT